MNVDHAITEYLKNKNQMPTWNGAGDHSPMFKKFLAMCSAYGLDIFQHFDKGISYKDIRVALLNGWGQPKCICGKNTEYALNQEGTHYAIRCSMVCRSNDPLFTKKIAKAKTELYSDPERKAETEAKKIATTMKNYGVPYPMQNTESFLKQQAACFKKDENGLHGYEPIAYKHLEPLYPDIELGTDYLTRTGLKIEWMGDDGKMHRSYPDFFSEDLNTFFEVKSDYTYQVGYEKINKCIQRLHEMEYGYILLVVRPGKSLNATCYNLNYIDD